MLTRKDVAKMLKQIRQDLKDMGKRPLVVDIHNAWDIRKAHYQEQFDRFRTIASWFQRSKRSSQSPT